MSNIVYGPFQSAHLGYWVAERLSGRGLDSFEPIGLARRYLQLAGGWRDHLLFQRTAD